MVSFLPGLRMDPAEIREGGLVKGKGWRVRRGFSGVQAVMANKYGPYLNFRSFPDLIFRNVLRFCKLGMSRRILA